METSKSRIYKIILFNILIFIFLYMIVDFTLGHFKIPYNFQAFRTKHPYYHHGMNPNITQFTDWGGMKYKMHTNSLGLRDSSVYKVPKKSGLKRILIMGDSHTEGVGVDYEKTFAGILQKYLKKGGIEVLNAAAVSYSQKIYYLKTDYLLNEVGLGVDEVWVFMDISDMQNEIAYENFAPKKPRALFGFQQAFARFLQEKSFTYNRLKSRRDAIRINNFLKKAPFFNPGMMDEAQKSTIQVYEDFFRDFNNDDLLRSPQFHGVGNWYSDSIMLPLAEKGIPLGQQNILKLDSICREKNVELTIFVHPWHEQILKGDTCDYYVSRWQEFCQKYKINFVNLFPLFINQEPPYSVIQKYYIWNDNHWNEEGHRKVAMYLLNNKTTLVNN